MFIPIHDANRWRHIGLHYATLGLIAANVVVFLLFQTPLGTPELMSGLSVIPAVFTGSAIRADEIALVPEPLTLLTYTFVHADIWHLAGNMVFLWVFGDNVEDALGHFRFLLFYAVCGIAGGFAHLFVEPGSVQHLIGASGAIAGVIAAYLVLHPRVWVWFLFMGKIPLRLPAFLLLGVWVVTQFVYAFSAGDLVVAWWAHVGGIVAGIVLIVPLRRRGVPLFDRGLVAANADQAHPQARP